jgi:uncharacterized alpha-E superfamily protein
MLGRTANDIFWMSRYLERAENTARLLEAGFRMALTRGAEAASEEWRSVITTLGKNPSYSAKYDDFTGQKVCNFVLRDPDNGDNVLSMFEVARDNARQSRSSITQEVWEAVNEGFMQLREKLKRSVRENDLGEVLAAIRRNATLVRGATYGSMLRNETYNFARAGTFLERADNTARILDVKYYLLLPSLAYIGTSLDTSQWDTVLRSVSGERAYHWLNSGRMEPKSITDFLILDRRFPRSLAFCYGQLRENLISLASQHGGEGRSKGMIYEADQRLAETPIGEILNRGLHQFLLQFIADNQALASAIAQDYKFAN